MTEPNTHAKDHADTVSVILPYFNRQETLRRAAESVLGQTHRDLMLYLVNDGSTDGSREVARSLVDERIVHVDASVNEGVCAARNLGLRAATTDLVAFQDSDDEWLPEKLHRQVQQLRALQSAGQPVSVLGCGWRYAGNKRSGKEFTPGPFTRLDLLRGVAGTGTPMLLIDRGTAAPEASFDVKLPSLEERDYVLSCLENGSLVGIIPEELVVVTRGRSDHVANPRGAATAWERYLDKYETDLAGHPDLHSWYHFRAAREYLVAGQRWSVRAHFRDAIKLHGLRRSIHLALGWLAGVKGFAIAQKILPL